MKKLVLVLVIVAVLFASPFHTFAAEEQVVSAASSDNVEYTYFEDGSYMVTVLTVEDVQASNTRAGDSYTISAKKYTKYYDTSDNLDWTVTLKGSFFVQSGNPDSGNCLSAELTFDINDSAWGKYDVDVRPITNNAYGFCLMKCKVLFVTIQTVEVTLTIGCDSQGNLH